MAADTTTVRDRLTGGRTRRAASGPSGEHQAVSIPEAEVRPAFWLLSRRGLAVLLVGFGMLIASLIWNYRSMFGVAAALVLSVALELVLVARPMQVKVRRELHPPVVERHGECMATLQVVGDAPSLVRTTLADRVGRSKVHVDWSGRQLTYRVPTLRRGLLPVGPLTVRRVGLFGLALASRERGEVDHVRVLPRLVPLAEMAKGRRRSAVGADESVEHGGTDLVGLHEYVPGDDLRRLHWATSARTGLLMVRDDADPANPHLTVILDDAADHYGDHGSTATDFEDAVEVAFALCRTAIQHGLAVHLLTTSGSVDVPVSERIAAADVDAQRVFAALAEVEAGPGRDQLRTPQRRLDTVAVISGSQARIDHLSGLAGRGAQGVVLVVDSSAELAPISTPSSGGGSVTVLRGPRSIDLAQLWDRAVQ